MKQFLRASVMALALTLPSISAAGPILRVSAGGDGATEEVHFTPDELLAMNTVEVRTDNDYVDKTTLFTGPLLRDLVAASDLKSDSVIVVTALNDYSTQIPVSEIIEYDVIVAVLMDGEEMSVRDKGPFWVIYPMDDHPELRDPGYNDRLIWQLAKIEVGN